jgi:hypothetical protein
MLTECCDYASQHACCALIIDIRISLRQATPNPRQSRPEKPHDGQALTWSKCSINAYAIDLALLALPEIEANHRH